MPNDLSLDQINALLAVNIFKEFVRLLWPAVSNDPFKGGYLTDAICDHLQALHLGQIRRLCIACPIRSGKSIITEVMFPGWIWARDPSLRIISASHTEDLSGRDSLRTRNLIKSKPYQTYFGHVFNMMEDQNTKAYYVNDRGGHRKAVGANTTASGGDADVILVDDLLDVKKAKSEAERKNVMDFYDTVLERRLVHGTGKDRVVIAGHRVHEEDLFAHIYNTYGNDGTWTYLVLPAEARPSITNSYFNGTGWTDTREEGELLNPERYPRHILDQEKKALRHEYHCIYQQDPTPREGDRFKAEWFKTYTEDQDAYVLGTKRFAKSKAWRVVTVDTAISTSDGADWTVAQVWDLIGQDMVLVHQMRKKLDGTKIVPALAQIYKDYSPQFLSIEQEFTGRFIIDQLRERNVPVKPFSAKGHGDKEQRAVSAEIRMEAGRVWFPANQPWMADLEKEVLAFPNGAHDDQVDCLSMACILATKFSGKAEPELSPEEQQERAKKEEQDRFNKILWSGCPF